MGKQVSEEEAAKRKRFAELMSSGVKRSVAAEMVGVAKEDLVKYESWLKYQKRLAQGLPGRYYADREEQRKGTAPILACGRCGKARPNSAFEFCPYCGQKYPHLFNKDEALESLEALSGIIERYCEAAILPRMKEQINLLMLYIERKGN